MIDADLAELYGETEKLQVVTDCDHLAKLKFSKTMPFAFTEHGAIQAAKVLSSDRAIDMGVYVVRAFVRQREALVSNNEMSLRLDELESQTQLVSFKLDTFENETRVQLKQLVDAIRKLMMSPASTEKRPIGFVTPEEKPAAK